MRKYLNLRANIALGLVFAFFVNSLGVLPLAQAQEFVLPAPGVMVPLSHEFYPPILKGIKIHPENPFKFDFVLDLGDNRLSPSGGDSSLANSQLKDESKRLIKYFLASLTIPEKDLWVNLSPYEKDRIIPQSFGMTEMGRDLLAEDYMLKQITASLIYPDGETGRIFWKHVYEEATKHYGTTNVPVNTFNKVWITPEKAVVYENAQVGTAYITDAKLKVMLEQDYLSLQKHEGITTQAKNANQLGSQIMREIVIPELTKEVNEGKNFAQLRQVYNSVILATWYKKKIRDSILSKVYEDQNKVGGINIHDPNEKEKIYQQYLMAFKKGVYNYIKDELDPLTQMPIPRKYFSGGITDLAMRINIKDGKVPQGELVRNNLDLITASIGAIDFPRILLNRDRAMSGGNSFERFFQIISSRSGIWNGKDNQDIVTTETEPDVPIRGRFNADLERLESRRDWNDPQSLLAFYETHKEAYHQISQAISQHKIPSGLPLILFDQHSDNLQKLGGVPLTSSNWVTAVQDERKVGDIFWIHSSRGDEALLRDLFWVYPKNGAEPYRRSTFKEQGDNFRQVIQNNLDDLRNGVVLSFDLDYFAPASPQYKPSAGEISERVKEIVNVFKEFSIPIRLINATYSTPTYALGAYREEFTEALVQASTQIDRAMNVPIINLISNETVPNANISNFGGRSMSYLLKLGLDPVLKAHSLTISQTPDILLIGATVHDVDVTLKRFPDAKITVVNLFPLYLNQIRDKYKKSSTELRLFLADAQKLSEYRNDNGEAYFSDESFDLIAAPGVDDSAFDYKDRKEIVTNIAEQEARLVRQGGYILHRYNNDISGDWENKYLDYQKKALDQGVLEYLKDSNSRGIFRKVDRAMTNKRMLPFTEVDMVRMKHIKISKSATGGIDLTPVDKNLQNQNNGIGIKFHLNPVQLAQLQNAPGFTVGNITISPLKSLPEFLGLTQAK